MENKIPNAIEFLQHAKGLCEKKNCGECPIGKDNYCSADCEFFDMLTIKTDEEIADIVQDVERWGKENGWWIEN